MRISFLFHNLYVCFLESVDQVSTEKELSEKKARKLIWYCLRHTHDQNRDGKTRFKEFCT